MSPLRTQLDIFEPNHRALARQNRQAARRALQDQSQSRVARALLHDHYQAEARRLEALARFENPARGTR